LLTIGPIAGPRKGARANNDIADPLSAALNMSAMIPLSVSASVPAIYQGAYPVEVRQEAPKVPAKNLNTINASRLFAPQQAALNAVKAVKVVQNMIRRPNTSEHGAQIRGPTTNPSTKPDVTIIQHLVIGAPLIFS
jgi:hypothetical protein